MPTKPKRIPKSRNSGMDNGSFAARERARNRASVTGMVATRKVPKRAASGSSPLLGRSVQNSVIRSTVSRNAAISSAANNDTDTNKHRAATLKHANDALQNNAKIKKVLGTGKVKPKKLRGRNKTR